ncbi:GNAT family N-acetyltransferase [Streptomyces sp. NPDC059783]|uniref:GNAT family N-acetyltransferase n=1 Tax=Streptomyces sp. NPDC059783 TaxID=3346944 RepID=UPI00364E9797
MTYSTRPGAQPTWTLAPASYDSDDVRDLLTGLHGEQHLMYGFADHPADTPAQHFAAPNGQFLLMRDTGGTAIGCGGWRRMDARTAEIKRMYVHPLHRGQSLGRQILHHLEEGAKLSGFGFVQLETGVDNTAALALYRSQGYEPITSYRAGRNPDVNRALRKPL